MAATAFLWCSFMICRLILAGSNPHGVIFDQRDSSQMRKVLFLLLEKIPLDLDKF